MKLTPAQRKQLRLALLAAFPGLADLTVMVDDQLGERLPVIVPTTGSLSETVQALIVWTAARGRLGDLISGARAANPGNLELLEFLDSVGLTAASAVPKATLEKVVSDNTAFLDVLKWREGLEEREFQVGRVESPVGAEGTAFLVGADLALTNYHVVQPIIDGSASGWSVRFGYKVASDGVAVDAGTRVEFAAAWQIDHAAYSPLDTRTLVERGGEEPGVEYLDFALIRLAQRIGDEPRRANAPDVRGWIRVPNQSPAWDKIRGIAILQHPKGDPLKLALGLPPDLTRNAPGSRIRYTTPTHNGSSGSPVFDTDWNLLALHHSGDPATIAVYNEAIPIDLIAARPAVRAALGL